MKRKQAPPAPRLATTPDTIDGKHYRVKELAALWGVSESLIRRKFNREPGVVRLGTDTTTRRRTYYTMLIPEAVAARVYNRSTFTGVKP